MTEHESIILAAAVNILRQWFPQNGMKGDGTTVYASRQCAHAADEIEYAMRCISRAEEDYSLSPAPDSRKVQA